MVWFATRTSRSELLWFEQNCSPELRTCVIGAEQVTAISLILMWAKDGLGAGANSMNWSAGQNPLAGFGF
jgi:hypothetical protein